MCKNKYFNKTNLFLYYSCTIHNLSSSGDVAFPEITLCPDYNSMSYNWDVLCKTYNVCDFQSFQRGTVLPKDTVFSTLRLRDYYRNITFSLEELISGFAVTTTNKNDQTNKRWVIVVWYEMILFSPAWIYRWKIIQIPNCMPICFVKTF